MRYIIAFGLWLVFTGATISDGMVAPKPSFDSRKLEYLGDMLASQYGWTKASDFTSSRQIQNKSLQVEFDSHQRISHLGLKVFSPQAREFVDPEIAEFLERILLELKLEDSRGQLNNKLKEYKIRLYCNQATWGSLLFHHFDTALMLADESAAFRISKDSLNYSALWENEMNESFEIQFPANYQLISGKDKKELDDQLELRFRESSDRFFMPADINHLTLVDCGSNIWKTKAASFVIPAVSDARYFCKSAEGLRWIYDRQFPVESFSNLFHYLPDINNQLSIRLTHRKYGKQTSNYTVPLTQVLSVLQPNFHTYVGFEECTSEEMNVVVFFYNTLGNYMHMLSIKTNKAEVFDTHEVCGELHTFIPEHNIKNLFSEYRDSGQFIPFKMK